MRKNLPQRLIVFLKTTGIKKPAKLILAGLIVVSLTNQASAQNLKTSALQQIKLLMAEKAARTPAQKKIDSHILLTLKQQNDASFAREIPSVKTGIKPDVKGKIKVDMDVHVSPQLISDLKALGADIIFSSQQFKNIVANIPLNKVEQVANMKAVLHINRWMAPTHNDPRNNNAPEHDKIAGGIVDAKDHPGFTTRANNIRKDLDKVFGPEKYNGTGNFIGAVSSEADVTHKADLARTVFGATGAGVKVGVLSDGVTGYTASQASGDLPPVITILPGQAGSGYEGRAMMELVHDIAPDADLYFATAFNGQASFAQNILDLRAAGCDIIVDDVTYYAEGVFQDDNVAQAVNAVTASGALYFSSAGNSGNVNDGTAGVWEGDFKDGGSLPLFPGGTVNDFGGGILYNTVSGTTGLVSLKWSDPLGLSANDYDLFATDAAGNSVVDYSTDIQDGNDNPFEALNYSFPAGYRFYIVKNNGAADRALHLNTNRGLLQINTPGVMYGHNAAGSAYTVAATPAATPFYSNFPPGPFPGPFNSTNVVEGFSSDGPRRIFYTPEGMEITPGNLLFTTDGGTLLQKPDITAADGVSTNTPGFEVFYGTSAAAPDAAAIAALVKSKFPALTPAQIRAALISSAIDIEAPGTDRDAGAGIIMAYEALEAAGATAVVIQASSPVTITAENAVPPNNAVDPGETVTVKLPLVNIGNASTTNLVATLQPTGGVTNPGGPESYGAVAGGSTAEMPFTFTAAGNCGDSITLTLALWDGSDDLGTITYKLKLGGTGPLSAPASFANTTPIVTNLTTNPATPYPSNIAVSGLTGKVAKLSVSLKQLNYTWVGDVDVLLVSPSGKKMVIMSDVDESAAGATNVDIMLSDDATTLLPASGGIVSGSYKPTNYGTGDAFPSPAPAAPYGNASPAGTVTLNGTFGGEDPNGTWSLYVVDDYTGLDQGNFNGGWELNITTAADVCSEVIPGPAISIADKTLKEGTNGYKLMYFNITLSENPSSEITVKYTTKDGTATSGNDYVKQSGVVTFPAGNLKTQKIAIIIKGDKVAEATETFDVVLSDAVNATIADGMAVGTILNNSGAAIAAADEDAASVASLGVKAIGIAPNPATTTTNVSLNGYNGNIVLLVSDMNGKILQQTKLQLKSSRSGLQKIDVSAYAAGTYFVTIIDEKGNKKTEKLVISR